MVLSEDLHEETESVARVVRSQVLNLASDKATKLVNDALESIVVELVEDAKIQYGVPLHSPLFVARVIGHLKCFSHESALKVDVLLSHDVSELVKGLVYDCGGQELLLNGIGFSC